MKFTLKSDYALNIIAIDKPPKYELKDTSCSTEKSSLLQVYCVSLLCQAPIVPMQFRHFYRKRSGRRKPEKETGWQQQVSL